ncbi:cation:proton antiporter [Thiomonas intermedia]|uniref:cation:proton antiporter n=1 Tax=Thiomonas intermedia TaxID=926 RepID=UPI0009A4ECD4|nr:cation:proton antiporter [Thiomonas intermedia]
MSTHTPLPVHATETLLFFTLLQLTVIVLAGRVGGVVALRLGQTAAVGEIVIGILLGPSLLGLLAPNLFAFVFHSTSGTPLQILSQIGLILLMFQIGLEFDFAHLGHRENRRAVLWIGVASMTAPFALGLGFGAASASTLSPDARFGISALFVATAFSITALPILGRILVDFDLHRTPLGVIAISAAAFNDVVGWLLLALVTMLAVSGFQPAAFGLKVALVVGFALIWVLAVRPLMRRIIRRLQSDGDDLSPNLLGVVLAAIFVSGMTTYQIGIFAIFGGFMMGVILHDQARLVQAWKTQISPFVLVFFLPIFFTYTGLRTDLGGLSSAPLWGWCLLLIALATLGKFGGAYLAARRCGMSRAQSGVMGALMNTRALMELIVINVGYDLGVLSHNVFTMLVLMAIFSTVITAPLLRLWLPHAALQSRPAQTIGTDHGSA